MPHAKTCPTCHQRIDYEVEKSVCQNVKCLKPITLGGKRGMHLRSDARYCSVNCKSAAWRQRHKTDPALMSRLAESVGIKLG